MTVNRTKYLNDYKREKLKRVPLELTKEKFAEVKKHADSRSESVNGFIKRAINETLERDSQDKPC